MKTSPLAPVLVSRRQALRYLGAGAAALALGRTGVAQTGAGGGAVAETRQPFALPKLPYAYDALEPHFDARTMEIHHTKHHQAYITAANKALESRPDLRELTGEQLLERVEAFEEPLRTTLRNHVGGHLNHAFFWSLLAAPADYRPGAARAAIDRQFGSLEAFKKEFAQAATSRFGSGWAWLVRQDGQLKVISTANQDSPLMQGATPIIGLDVWEHAYYLRYQNRRADYIAAFWAVLNWDVVEKNYGDAATL